MTRVLCPPRKTGTMQWARLLILVPIAGVLVAMMINLSISIGGTAQIPGVGQVLPGVAHTTTVAAFSRDFVVYDSDIMRGNNSADVHVSGTTSAPDGAVIEARAVSVDDGGATTTKWRPVATATGSAWAGVLATPRSASWYRAEVRVQGSAAPAAQTANRFGVGLVIYHHRQSNGVRLYHTPGSVPAPDLTGIGSDLQVFRIENRGAPTDPDTTDPSDINGPLFVTDTDSVTSPLGAMGEIFLRNAPGLKVMILADIKAGESIIQTLSDGSITRRFSTMQNLFAAALPEPGQEVGAAIMDHWNDIFTTPEIIKSRVESAFFGGDGGEPGVPYLSLTSGTANHAFHEVMPGVLNGRTKILLGGFGGIYTVFSAGYPSDVENRLLAFELLEAAWPDRFKTMLNYDGLISRYDGGINDPNHFPVNLPYGAPYFGALVGAGVLHAAGILTFAPPQFDNVFVEPTGAYIDIWSSQGPVTTIERQEALAESRAPVNYVLNPSDDPVSRDLTPGQREVISMMFGDLAMPQRVEIVDANGAPAASGRVRIYPDSGAFDRNTQLHQGYSVGGFRFAGATGDTTSMGYARDLPIQRHFPIIDMGVQGRILEHGLVVEPQINPNWINTAIAEAFPTTEYTFLAAAPYPGQSLGSATPTQGVTLHTRFKPLGAGFAPVMAQQSSNEFGVIWSSNDGLRLRATHSFSNPLFPSSYGTNANNLATDAEGFIEVLVHINTQTQQRIEVYEMNDGVWVPRDDNDLWFDNTAFLQPLGTNLRYVPWHAISASAVNNLVDFVRVWWGENQGATPPAGRPWRAIEADHAGAFDAATIGGTGSLGRYDIFDSGVTRLP